MIDERFACVKLLLEKHVPHHEWEQGFSELLAEVDELRAEVAEVLANAQELAGEHGDMTRRIVAMQDQLEAAHIGAGRAERGEDATMGPAPAPHLCWQCERMIDFTLYRPGDSFCCAACAEENGPRPAPSAEEKP